VDLINLTLAMVHGCFAQASFCLIVFAWMVTSRWWPSAPDLSAGDDAVQGRFLIRLAVISVCIVFGQLIVGSVMRHLKAGLAIPDLPWAYGKLLPPTNQSELAAANHLRASKLNLDPVTLGQIWLHFRASPGGDCCFEYAGGIDQCDLLAASPSPRSGGAGGGFGIAAGDAGDTRAVQRVSAKAGGYCQFACGGGSFGAGDGVFYCSARDEAVFLVGS